MNSKLILQSALANAGNKNSSEQILSFLKENIPDSECHKRVPRVGMIVNYAFDWQMILGTASSIITVAGALWTAYEKFIVPIKVKKNNAFLFVQIKNEKKESIQFILGEEYQDKNTFVKSFTEKVETIRISNDSEVIEIERKETEFLEFTRKY